MNDILTLIQQTQGVDEYGDPAITESRRDVFCRLASIGQKEFYQAHAVGLQPELKFVLSDYLDYSGETLVEYDGQKYRVLRTYRTGNEMELVVYREVNAA
jgi:SPP1 family predicted phage head-tail adaptor